jgi:hypothetical protein
MPSFTTTLQLHGRTATGLEVPPEVVDALGAGRKPAVHVRIGEYAYRSTVAPRGDRYLVPVSGEHRAGAGVAAGDTVEVTLELDTDPREVEVPGDLAEALDRRGARAAFDALSTSRRKGHVLSVEGARTPETRERRVAKVVAELAPS